MKKLNQAEQLGRSPTQSEANSKRSELRAEGELKAKRTAKPWN